MNSLKSPLAPGTILVGKYKIEKMLGRGGFGITYLAIRTSDGEKVAIKEFFFREYCERSAGTSVVTVPSQGQKEFVERFRKKFIKEAATLRSLHHKNIVEVEDVFDANGTSYYAMAYVEGGALSSLIAERGALSADECMRIIGEVSDAVDYIHSRHINHLDIKPDNIMTNPAIGNVMLIDFGVAKHYDPDTLSGTTTTPAGISHGFSPLEQYTPGGVARFSPQADIYSLGATLFNMVTGKQPPQAVEAAQSVSALNALSLLPPQYTNLAEAVREAMNADPQKRPASVKQFMKIVNVGGSGYGGNGGSSTVVSETSGKSDKSKSKKTGLIAGGLIVIAILAVIIFGLTSHKGDTHPAPLVDTLAVEEELPFTVERFSDQVQGHTSTCHITLDLPTQGNEALVDSVRTWINTELGSSYKGDLADNASLFAHYKRGLVDDEGCESNIRLVKDYETETFITFKLDRSDYCEGAAHGMDVTSGATFRKSDGVRLSKQMIGDFYQYRPSVLKGLKNYFGVTSDQELYDNLQLDEGLDNLPAPSNDPWLSSEGLVFKYTPYEIAPFSSGLPEATVPFSEIEHVLRKSAPGFLE